VLIVRKCEVELTLSAETDFIIRYCESIGMSNPTYKTIILHHFGSFTS
jgi:hypothetical protein